MPYKTENNNGSNSGNPDLDNLKNIKIWLFVIPGYLIFCSVTEVLFDLHLHLFDLLDDLQKWIGPGYPRRIILLSIMFGMPALAIIINTLSILEMYYFHDRRELRMRIKNKPVRILIVLLSILIFGLFVVYQVSKEK
ncbi:MAG: hypothetical protein CVV24_06965 [Ignavibacteriae bacterium HGW-Ignavibacteriae-3]|nr:MAG: hypothetical protein CVV24_06965 [Ignavibacteriae bacterium HGW-Ignavibacteriae-3]